MVEENNPVELNSSQESLIYSQETFDLLWSQYVGPPMISGNDVSLASCSDMLTGLNDVKMEMFDSSVPQEGTEESNSQAAAFGAPEHVVSSTFEAQIPSPSVSTQHAPSSLPANSTWPGRYNFTVSFGPQEKRTKSISWTYSKLNDKLYVLKDTPCPVFFSTCSRMPPGVTIRVMALYSSPEQVTEVVKRCVNHSMNELNQGIQEAEHLVRCECPAASYFEDPATGRHSVIVPFENPPVGQQHSIYIYKFTCFGSCAGGPNRRPIMLIFTLERGDEVLGRKKLDVKICACPGRDRKTEEKQHFETESPHPKEGGKSLKRKAVTESTNLVNLWDTLNFTKPVSFPSAKKSKPLPDKDGHYTLQVDNLECFQFLSEMKKFYELCKIMEDLSPDITRALLNYKKPKSGETD